MSAWKLLVDRIHKHGPIRGSAAEGRTIQDARKHGLIAKVGERWALTGLGLDWCRGGLRTVQTRPGGLRFIAAFPCELPPLRA